MNLQDIATKLQTLSMINNDSKYEKIYDFILECYERSLEDVEFADKFREVLEHWGTNNQETCIITNMQIYEYLNDHDKSLEIFEFELVNGDSQTIDFDTYIKILDYEECH